MAFVPQSLFFNSFDQLLKKYIKTIKLNSFFRNPLETYKL